ncbi:MAG: nucleotidyltransferase domain-containing protein [Bacteroidota bacterium]
MVEIPTVIKNKLYVFLNELSKNNFKIDKAYLFGSYAKGTNNEWSDIDLAVVSENFEGNRLFDKDKIRKFLAIVDYDISPLPYRPEDFTEDDLFVKEIIQTGIRIV